MADGRRFDPVLPMKRRRVAIARLNPDQVARYEALHDQFPEANQSEMRAAGFDLVEVYRAGEVLTMIIETQGPIDPHFAESSLDRAWQAVVEPCFAEGWQDAIPVFTLSAAPTGQGGR